MLALKACLCVSSLALATGHKLDGSKFGSKSSYFTVANQDTSNLENYEGCEPVMMWMYVRHGSRNPGDDEIIEMNTLLPELRDRIVAAADAGEGGLTFSEIRDLKKWKFDLTPADDKLLTDSGKMEALEMGQRWRQRLPNFLGDQNNVEARSSYKSRTIETGNGFLEGLELQQNTYIDNSKSIYYKNEFGCDRYEQEVYDNDNVTEAEAIRFTESQVWTDMLEGVSQRAGVQVTPAEARLAHKMCKYQLAREPERYTDANYTTAEYPPWCNLFTKEDMALWEFEGDLESHYGSGPAFDITTYAPHKLFTEIYSLIDAHSAGGQKPNASAVLTFGHSGGIKPIINAFEHVRDDRNLTAEDFGTDYKWKISNIGTFASNIGIIMYSCSGGAENKVMLVHNEHIMEEQPACGKALCSVEEFKAKYQHIVDFDWDSECPVPVPEVDYNDYDNDMAGVEDENSVNLDNCGKDGETVICGDQCIKYNAYCQCGSEKFHPQETDQQCCLPAGGSCSQAGPWGDTVCPQGRALSKSTPCGNTATEVVNVINEAGKNNTEVINITNIINIYPGGSTTEANSEDETEDCKCDDDDSDEDDSDEEDSSEEKDSSEEEDSSEEKKDKKKKKCHNKKCHKNK